MFTKDLLFFWFLGRLLDIEVLQRFLRLRGKNLWGGWNVVLAKKIPNF
jgi:hypothetical protein